MSTATLPKKTRKQTRIPDATQGRSPAGKQAPGSFRDESKLPWQMNSADFAAEVAKIYKGHVSEGAAMFHPLVPVNPRHDRVIHTIASQVAKELFRLSAECLELARRVPAPKTRSQVPAWEHQRKHLKDLADTAIRLFWVEVEAEMNHRQEPENMSICEGWKIVVEKEEEASPGSLLAHLLAGGMRPVSLEELMASRLEREGGENGKGRPGTNGHGG